MVAALDISYPTDALNEIIQSRADETAVCQNTKVELYPFWYLQPVKITEKRNDVFRMPR